jgi:hypothetical protein
MIGIAKDAVAAKMRILSDILMAPYNMRTQSLGLFQGCSGVRLEAGRDF